MQFQQFVKDTPAVSDPALMRYPAPNPCVFYTAPFEPAAYIFNDLLKHRKTPPLSAKRPTAEVRRERERA
jgi:hypothetical protein